MPTVSVERNCPICFAAYLANPARLRHGRQTTCSRACSYALRNPPTAETVQCACTTCGGEIERPIRAVRSKHGGVFCSRACHYAARTDGTVPRVIESPYVRVAPPDPPEVHARRWATRRRNGTDRASDETRARIRTATVRRLAGTENSYTSSKLEDRVAVALASLGIGYTRQFPLRDSLGRYIGVLDFLLADGSALEVNGTYWHSDPRVYPDGPSTRAQRTGEERWARKVAALRDRGIPLCVLWELDFKADPDAALAAALA